MYAIKFNISALNYLLTKVFGFVYKPFYWSRLSGLNYSNIEEPSLPGADWAKIKVKYGGICGSDINLIKLEDSPYASPFSSSVFVMGHENLGYIEELGNKVKDLKIGDRVVVDPLLPCTARGIATVCDSCQKGEYSRCQNFNRGSISPGLIIGTCADTGGSWSHCFVAHKSQIFKVPENVTDENAILIDPFCSALHPVMRNLPSDDDVVLVVGGGIIGICIIASIRALKIKSRIIILSKYDYQSKIALKFGADEAISIESSKDYYYDLCKSLNSILYKPILGKRIIVGGADIVFECVGNDNSIDDSLRFTKSGGKMVLVGLAGIQKNIDWTPVWLNEINIIGSFASSSENYNGRCLRTYKVALEFMSCGKVDLSSLLTHKFELSDYKNALMTNLNKNKYKVVKSVFHL